MDNKKVIVELEKYLTPGKIERLKDVLAKRTRFITVVLEDIYQAHNASAVLRSCDCYGIQDVYTIEDRNRISVCEGVTKSSHKWLTLNRFKATDDLFKKDCYKHLRAKGYKIVATTPHGDGISINKLPIDNPVALFVGNEKEGLSEETLFEADYHVKIPMFGFSESLNLSVSAAICLYDLSIRLRSLKESEAWTLSEEEQEIIYTEWLKISVRASDKILEKARDK